MADLELEIEKATAIKRLEIAKDTARKEKEIMQQFRNENLSVIWLSKVFFFNFVLQTLFL